MILEQTLVAVLAEALPGTLFPQIAPDSQPTPYGIYQEIASPTENTLDNTIPIQQSILQIDIYDRTYAGVKATGSAVEAAIQAAFLAGTLVGIQHTRRSLYEPDVKLHRLMYEFSFWYH